MKIAACFAGAQTDSVATAARMGAAQHLAPFHTSETERCGERGAVARVHTSDQYASVAFFRTHPNGNRLWATGLPFLLEGDLEAALDAACAGGVAAAVERLPKLDGAFAILVWDCAQEKLVIVTDFLGMQPLFGVRRDGLFLLATDVQGLTASGLVPVEMDLLGWGGFTMFLSCVAEASMLRDAKRLPPASIMVYTPSTGACETDTYWQHPGEPKDIPLAAVETEGMVDALTREAQRYAACHAPGQLLLSGGFDSRLNLMLCDRIGLRPDCIVAEHADQRFNLDGDLAVAIAKRMHASHRMIRMDPDFFSSVGYFDFLRFNEVAYPTIKIFISSVMQHLRPEAGAVWEGCFTGSFMKPLMSERGAFETYLTRVYPLEENRVWIGSEQVFHPSLRRQMRDAFLDWLEAERARYPQSEFGVQHFATYHRARTRFSLQPLKVYANVALPFTPGLSRTFFEETAKAPMEYRWHGQLSMELLRRHFPKACSVPFASTASKMITPSRWNPTYLRHRVMQSLRFRKDTGSLINKFIPPFAWSPLRLVDQVVAMADPGHPDLDADAVRRLQQAGEPGDWRTQEAKNLLFYWQMWRWILEGQHAEKRRVLFGE